MTRLPIPPDCSARLAAFFAAELTGQITLNVKDGQILAWELRETGRVHEKQDRSTLLQEPARFPPN